MISSICIRGIATYPKDAETRIDGLRKQCLFFGDNGSGKTPISRVIAKPTPDGSFTAPADTLFQVYNSDFVEKAYRESSYPGVFTLGEKEREIEERIDSLRDEKTQVDSHISGFEAQIRETRELTVENRNKLEEAVWTAKSQIHASLQDAFKGYQRSKEKLLEQLLRLTLQGTVQAEGDLVKEAEDLFGTPPPRRDLLSALNSSRLTEVEAAEEWSRVLVGSHDVPLAALISRLHSSDWVRKGIGLLDQAQCCPFCQQPAPQGLKEDLERVFDRTYEEGVTRLRQLRDEYARESGLVEAALEGIQSALSESVGFDLGRLRTVLAENRAAMSRKVDAPSAPVAVTDTSVMLRHVEAAIQAENEGRRTSNARLDNRRTEAQRLVDEIWQLLLQRASANISQFHQDEANCQKKLGGLQSKLDSEKQRQAEIEPELVRLQSSLASVEGAVTKINRLLERFGFDGFRLKVSDDQKHYVLVREGDKPAEKTLSEGEKTLVSFLYFYHLAQGGLAEAETAKKRVLVIDDPISSLDANVLFLVSTLVREMLGWALDEKGLVEQVIVLTHNAYFHKEVAAEKRDKQVKGLQYWMVKKVNGTSRVELCQRNPIRSSYSLLWSTVRAVRDGRDVDHPSVANAMRRILENYFFFLGGTWDEGLRNHFSGEDLTVLNALISWVHDGSHRVFDGLEIGPGHTALQYLLVFERIFEKSGHGAHFTMMMGGEEL